MYLLLSVDDMFIISKNIFEINSLKDRLSGEYEMKDFGATIMILDMKIHID